MNLNNKLFALVAGALLCFGCGDDPGFIDAKDTQRIPALNSATISPLSNESGSIRAYVGTEVSVQGFNLDRIGAVTMDDIEVELTAQSIKELKFRIPALDYAQNDLPYAVKLRAYDLDKQSIFTYDYFVTVPVTDALVTGFVPAEGTVGAEITVSGRNLGQVTRIRFGGATVEAADFAEVDDEGAFVKFRVPAGDYAGPDTEAAIVAEWGTETIDVTGETPFVLHVPVFDALAAQPEGVNSLIGDELELTGRNLDLVSEVKWGDKALPLVAQSAEALTVRFSASIEQADPVVQTKALVAEWGLSEPAQTEVLADAWRVDTTPSSSVVVPEFGQMTVEGGKFYLGKTVTVTGANLTTVEKIELQYGAERIEAEMLAGATDSELKFTVPDGVTFAKACEVSVAAFHNGGEQLEIGKATVYPFYYYKDITIGAQDALNADMAFFVPDRGGVIPTSEWAALDKYASANAMTAAMTLNKDEITETQYYEVLPYFFSTYSGGYLTLQSPSNSKSQLKNFKADGVNIAGNETFGVPVVCFRVLKTSVAAENAIIEAVKGGSLETMISTVRASAGAPKYAVDFNVGDVVLVQYVTYAYGVKNPTPDDVCREGFIHVKAVTEATAKGRVTFDFYWSKTLNK